MPQPTKMTKFLEKKHGLVYRITPVYVRCKILFQHASPGNGSGWV